MSSSKSLAGLQQGRTLEGQAAELSCCEVIPANIHFTVASVLLFTLLVHIGLYQTAIVISSCCYDITNHANQGTHDTCNVGNHIS